VKYFLDCGSNLGQGYEYFRQKYGDEWNYILFEPNKNCYDKLIEKYGNTSNVKMYNRAVYTEDCVKQFRFTSKFCVGGSIIVGHNSGISHNTQVTSVSCVNILKIIGDMVSGNDEIIIKLDIESSEYDVLEKMIQSKLIFKVRKIYCEFHSQYMDRKNKKNFEKRENSILSFVKKNNICFELWK
jgi:FkbM family methyltransferase